MKHLALRNTTGFQRGNYSKTYSAGTICIVYSAIDHNQHLDLKWLGDELKKAHKLNEGKSGPPAYLVVIVAGEFITVMPREQMAVIDIDQPEPAINLAGFRAGPITLQQSEVVPAAAPESVKTAKKAPQRSLFERGITR